MHQVVIPLSLVINRQEKRTARELFSAELLHVNLKRLKHDFEETTGSKK